jgi:hypothetical protein
MKIYEADAERRMAFDRLITRHKITFGFMVEGNPWECEKHSNGKRRRVDHDVPEGLTKMDADGKLWLWISSKRLLLY